MTNTLTPPWLNQLAPNATLTASTLNLPVHGREAIIKIIQTAGRMYESHTVVYSGSFEGRDLVEYDAVAYGGFAIHGVVTLTKNYDGEIVAVGAHHGPLSSVVKLSNALRIALGPDFGPEYFQPEA